MSRIRLAALAALVASTAHAGELRLANGAMLPGEMVRMETSHVVWKAEMVGEVRVLKANVVSMTSAVRRDLKLAGTKEALEDCALNGNARGMRVQCGDAEAIEVAITDVEEWSPGRPFTGRVALAADIQHGNTETSEYELDLRTSVKRGRLRHNLEADIDYETNRVVETQNETEGNYQLDYLLRDGWFIYSRANYYRNDFSSLNQVFALGGGVGRDMLWNNGAYASVQAGVSEARFVVEDVEQSNTRVGIVRWRTGWRMPWWEVRLFHECEFNWMLDRSYLNRFESSTGVNVPLLAGLIGELRYDWDHLGTRNDGGERTDSEWVLALGYQW